MIPWVIVDSGPLTAFMDADDSSHGWAVRQFREFSGPLLTVEPVITEVLFLLRRSAFVQDEVLKLVSEGFLRIPFQLTAECEAVRRLRAKYRERPMSLADACLVRLSEIFERHRVCTLDPDFAIYRRNGRDPIPLITPG